VTAQRGRAPFRTGEGLVLLDVGGVGAEEILELHDAAHVLELELDQKAPACRGQKAEGRAALLRAGFGRLGQRSSKCCMVGLVG
jgi:hypothetical protein